MKGSDDLLEEGLAYERGGALQRALERYMSVVEMGPGPATEARAYVRISHVHRTRCEWPEALQAALRAAELSATPELSAARAEALNAEAAVYHSRGELERAAGLYARIPEVSSDPRVCGMAYQNLGAVAAVQGDLITAEARFEEALRCFERAHDASGQAHVLNSFTALALDRKDYELAAERGNRAVNAAKMLGDLDLLGIAQYNFAEALGGLGRFEQAEAVATAALGEFQITGNLLRRAACLRTLGLLSEAQQRYALARRFYLRALDVAEAIGVERDVAELKRQLDALPEE